MRLCGVSRPYFSLPSRDFSYLRVSVSAGRPDPHCTNGFRGSSASATCSFLFRSSFSRLSFSALWLVDLALPGRGGVLGAAISKPALAAVDSAATVVFLLAFIVAALIVAFDIHLGALFTRWRERIRAMSARDVATEIDVPVTGLSVEPEPDEAETPPPAEAEPEDREDAPRDHEKIREPQISQKTDSDGFPIIAATGSAYTPPPISILAKNKGKPEVGDVKANMNIIKRTL